MTSKSSSGAGRSTGFTLVELMVTITVLAVLAAIALPNFRSLIRRNAVSTQVNALLADLQYARSEAISTRSLVSLCSRSPTAGAADKTCATSGSKTYDGGWLVYTATTSGTAFDAAKTGQTLLHVTTPPETVSIRADSAAIPTFNARGELSGGDLVFLICSKPSAGQTEEGESTKSVPGRRVSMAASGRVSSSSLAAGDSCK